VTRDSATALLALENVACVCGSWMVPPEQLEAEDWEGIERLAREASALAKRTDHFLP
jgi:2-dehydro-3-deoxyphosphogluconate aldolase/(4S)-4-hydroxy-2-oxoglutarate aldolase